MDSRETKRTVPVPSVGADGEQPNSQTTTQSIAEETAENNPQEKDLEEMLFANLTTSDIRSLAGIAKQYRETIREIEEIEGGQKDDDELGAILAQREADGKPSSVR